MTTTSPYITILAPFKGTMRLRVIVCLFTCVHILRSECMSLSLWHPFRRISPYFINYAFVDHSVSFHVCAFLTASHLSSIIWAYHPIIIINLEESQEQECDLHSE